MLFSGNKKRVEELEDSIELLTKKVAELTKQNSTTQAILSSMIEGVIAVDKETKITSVNQSIESIFDVKRDEIEGRIFLEAIRNNDISNIISDVLKNKKFISTELSLVWPMQKVFQVNVTPLFEKNDISGCLLVIHDITEMRKLETVRRDFVANVSHELKTPLTSIMGFMETLLEGALDDKENSRVFLKIIQDHAARLNNLINDLLSLSHLESKQMILGKKSFNLVQQVEEVILGFSSQLKKKNIQVKNELPGDFVILADKGRMDQVFTNLIDNAIKFNKENGSIRIYSELSADKKRIIVEDSGLGIPEKDIPRIFERFYRVDKARSRELGGTGLGLSIVKHIVELHGGSIGVESIEGLGSKFWLTLP